MDRVPKPVPTEGPRTIAAQLRLQRFGAWRVSHGSVFNVLARAELSRTRVRLTAAEAVAVAEGGTIAERALRDLRANTREVTHIGSDTPGEQVFFDTMYIGKLKGVGKLWQYSAVDGASSFGIARVVAGDKSAAAAARLLDTDLQAWLRFYNYERPHRGYRLRGRRPGAVLYAHHPEILTLKGWEPHDVTA